MMEAASLPVHSLKVFGQSKVCVPVVQIHLVQDQGHSSQLPTSSVLTNTVVAFCQSLQLAGERVGLHPNLLDSESIAFEVLA